MTKFSKFLCFLIAGALAASVARAQGVGDVARLDAAVENIVPADARVEKLAEGFGFLEGPVWVRKGNYLLFSDIPANVIDKRTPDGKVSVFLTPSGFTD